MFGHLKMDQIYLSLITLYLLTAGDDLSSLFSCSVKRYLKHGMLTKHILAMFTLFITIIASSESKIKGSSSQLLATLFVYVWFVLTTKCEINFLIAILFIIAVGYIIKEYVESIEHSDKTHHHDKIYYNTLKKNIQKLTLGIALTVTFIGVANYYTKQKKDHGKSFSFYKFIVGTEKCSHGE